MRCALRGAGIAFCFAGDPLFTRADRADSLLSLRSSVCVDVKINELLESTGFVCVCTRSARACVDIS